MKRKMTEINESIEEFINRLNSDDTAKHHTNYFHYTTIENADKILNSGTFWLNNFEKDGNDKNDRRQGEFSLCFSTGTSENLPLWYLYSGIDGKGVRLGLKKKDFIDLINNPKLYIAEYDSKNHILIPGTEREIDKSKVAARDILYIGKDSTKNAYRLKYNGASQFDISEEEYQIMKCEYEHTKGLIWFYEKETRIQVKAEDIDESKEYRVVLDISKIIPKIKLRFAPNVDDEYKTKILSEKQGFRKYARSLFEDSDYKGEIDLKLQKKYIESLNLCDKCLKKIKEN